MRKLLFSKFTHFGSFRGKNGTGTKAPMPVHSCFILRRYSSDPRPTNFAVFHRKGPPVFLRLSHSEVNPAPGGAHSADCGSTSILVLRTVILPPGFSVMTLYKVGASCSDPEQILVTTVGNNVIHNRCFSIASLLSAFRTKRVALKERFTCASASGNASRALRPAVLPPGGEACVSRKTVPGTN